MPEVPVVSIPSGLLIPPPSPSLPYVEAPEGENNALSQEQSYQSPQRGRGPDFATSAGDTGFYGELGRAPRGTGGLPEQATDQGAAGPGSSSIPGMPHLFQVLGGRL